MNKFTKLTLSAMLSAATILAPVSMVSTSIFAAGNETVTINNAPEGTYNIYQLFTGTYPTPDTTNQMGDIAVNVTYKPYILQAIQHFDSNFTLDSSTSESAQSTALAQRLAELSGSTADTYGDNTQDGRDFANYLAGLLAAATPTSTGTAASGTISFTGLDTGFYLVSSASTNDNSQTTALMLPVNTGGQTVNVKTTVPAIDKKVKTAAGTTYTDYVDQGITNNAVNQTMFELTGTLPSNLGDYTTYQYIFTDTLPSGMTATDAEVTPSTGSWSTRVEASLGSTTADISSAFTGAVNTAGDEVTWTATDILSALKAAFPNATDLNNAEIVLTYTPVFDSTDLDNMYAAESTLTSPLENSATLTYTKSPYESFTATTSTTPAAVARTYSYNLTINKVDENAAALTGAEFTLTNASGDSIGKLITTGTDLSTFTFTGLEAGTQYTLTETKVPSGHKAIDPVKFTINETPDASGTGIASIAVTENSDPSNGADLTTADATVTATVVNNVGPNMPVTGEQGILLGVIVGVLLIGGCAIVIARRKTSEQN